MTVLGASANAGAAGTTIHRTSDVAVIPSRQRRVIVGVRQRGGRRDHASHNRTEHGSRRLHDPVGRPVRADRYIGDAGARTAALSIQNNTEPCPLAAKGSAPMPIARSAGNAATPASNPGTTTTQPAPRSPSMPPLARRRTRAPTDHQQRDAGRYDERDPAGRNDHCFHVHARYRPVVRPDLRGDAVEHGRKREHHCRYLKPAVEVQARQRQRGQQRTGTTHDRTQAQGGPDGPSRRARNSRHFERNEIG